MRPAVRDPLLEPGVPRLCPICARELQAKPKRCVHPHHPPLKTTVFLTVEDIRSWLELRPEEGCHPPLLIPVLCCNCYEVEIVLEQRAKKRIAEEARRRGA